LFGAYAFFDGVVVLTFGLMAAGTHGRWWPLVLGGIVGLAIGVLTFVQPAATALALVYVIGAWAIVTGVLEIIGAIRLRKVISNELLMGFSGGVSIVFGALVLAQPGTGAVTLVFLFGYYAILAGISQIALGSACVGWEKSYSRVRRAQPRPHAEGQFTRQAEHGGTAGRTNAPTRPTQPSHGVQLRARGPQHCLAGTCGSPPALRRKPSMRSLGGASLLQNCKQARG
jgi:uncharacterized membrane protein HdeD (DUF308 family)